MTSGGSCETLQHPSGQTHSAGGLECDVSNALFPLGYKALLEKCVNLKDVHEKVKVKKIKFEIDKQENMIIS